MAEGEAGTAVKDIPSGVFEEFISELAKEDVPAEVVAALKKAILEDHALSEAGLRAALVFEENVI
jgi:hypothetical protein